jgi:hypothetical protein
MPNIVATPGGATANSYCTLDEADAYHETRLFVGSWTGAGDDTKTAALLEAARRLDASFDWTGSAATRAQVLCWPRIGMASRNAFPIDPTVIPQPIKDAQAEFARQLIARDRLADNDAQKFGITDFKAGPVGLTFKDPEAGSDVPSKDADVRRRGPDFDYLAKWVPDAVRNLLVKSWYKQPLVSQPLIFEAIGGPARGRR